MKISYQCWKQGQKPHDIFFMALQRTLSDQKILADYKLQCMLKGSRTDQTKKQPSALFGISNSSSQSSSQSRFSSIQHSERQEEDLLLKLLIQDTVGKGSP